MKKEEYINEVLSCIKSKNKKALIKSELSNHIDDRIEYYTEIGYDEETALKKAIDKMGNANDTGTKLNNLHNERKSIILSIFFLVIFIVGMIIASVRFYYFAIISSDPVELTYFGYIISLLTFASGMLCYNIAFKNRLTDIMSAFGISSLIGMLSPFAFLPFGYSITGLVFDFPAAVKNSEEYLFIGREIGSAIDNSTVYYILLALTALFFFVPLIWGIVGLLCYKELKKEENGTSSNKKLTDFKRFGNLLIILTIIGTMTFTIEAAVYEIKIIADNKKFDAMEEIDAREAQEIFNSIELPINKDDLKELGFDGEYNEEDAKEYGFTETIIYTNMHFGVQLWDNDADGVYDEKRIFATFDSRIRKSDFEKIKIGMTTSEVFDIIPVSQANDYSYIITDSGYEEQIDFCADGEPIKHYISASLYVTAENGIVTDIEYSPAKKWDSFQHEFVPVEKG
ncbi:MAG: hypothetical protein J1E36_04225 [Eubacterium sp.]|nr:hypothetical protein [Eubacterium sp.]